MKEAVFCCALVVAIAVLPTAVSGQASTVRFVEADANAAAIELLAEPASYVRPTHDEFTELGAAGECSSTRMRGIDVTLRWEVTRSQVEAHRIDITMFHDGFKTGRYLTSGERPVASGARSATQGQLLFETAEPGLYYYWRLLTKTPAGWVVSGSGRFDSPTCPVDMVPE